MIHGVIHARFTLTLPDEIHADETTDDRRQTRARASSATLLSSPYLSPGLWI